MRLLSVSALLAALVLTACDDPPSRPSGPVKIRFLSDTANDVIISGELVMDDTIAITLPDSVLNVQRGEYHIRGRLNVDYIPFDFTLILDPPGSEISLHPILFLQEPVCVHVFTANNLAACQRSAVYWQGHTRLYCPTSDFGEFCTDDVDRLGLGLSWPDSVGVADNSYVSRTKLLIGAILGTENPAVAGDTLAMDFEVDPTLDIAIPGDYSTRRRLHVAAGDSTRWQQEVWTDTRHFPSYWAQDPALGSADRFGANFGLSVRATAYLPPGHRDALLIRYDVKNISATDSFRFVHPEEPATGHTLTNVYLAPFIDPNIGGGTSLQEARDDNATVFPAEALIVAYDQTFSVGTFAGSYREAPGLVGFQLIAAPPGTTPKAVIASTNVTLTYATNVEEDSTYAIISGGRAGAISAQACTSTADALVCAGELSSDTRAGWSVGPLTLAPNDETFVIVGVLLQPPKTGSFTSGTEVRPQNDRLNDNTRTIYTIAERLRTLAAQTKNLTVNGAPGR